jgi:SmpA / OmlA family
MKPTLTSLIFGLASGCAALLSASAGAQSSAPTVAASATQTGPQSGPQAAELDSGYLCCNMRSDGSWISDANYLEAGKTTVPLGTPVSVLGFGRYRVNVKINGQPQAIGNDYSRYVAMDAFAKRYVVKDDPRAQLATMPSKIRTAVESARVTKGMTRDQVLMALGYPIASENPHLDAATWKYWLWTFSPYRVVFDSNGLVSRVSGSEDTLANVYLP